MRLLIDHLTRMSAPHVCIAGLNDRNEHVRPVLGRQIRRDELDVSGGRIVLGAVVDFGPMRPVGKQPEVEDHHFDLSRVKVLEAVDSETFWDLLGQAAAGSLAEIFGPALQRDGRTFALPEGEGRASLGSLRPRSIEPLTVEFDRLRLALDDGTDRVSVPVTDIRLFLDDHKTTDADVVQRANEAIRRGRQFLLSVGVGRAWDATGETPRHWLQVNNLFVEPT